MIDATHPLDPERPQPERQRTPRTRPDAADVTSYRVGKLAYEGYRSAANGKSLISGTPLPPWSHLRREMREAWHAAADAVWGDCIAMCRSRGALR